MKKIILIILAITLTLSLVPLDAFCLAQPNEIQQNKDYTSFPTFDILNDFLEACPSRVAGSEGEKNASIYLRDKFLSYGLECKIEEFQFQKDGLIATSYNVVASTKITSPNLKQIVIGAHYDNVNVGNGASDNASGITALLSIAKAIATSTTKFNIVFVAFGAEELGMLGSLRYVANLSTTQRDNIALMVNIDSISMGDNVYFYAEDINTDYNNMFVDVANNNAYGIKTYAKPISKGIITGFSGLGTYPYFQMAQSSDNSSFRSVNIPTVSIFSGNYNTAIGYKESSVTSNNVMHTPNDTLEFGLKALGDDYLKKIEIVSNCVVNILTNIQFEANIITAREQMVAKFWLSPWFASAICFVVLIVCGILGYLYINKLKKNAILGDTEIKNNRIFKPESSDDIYKL
ncbi:MAG: M20/M25/M40 family metallo-hydrolase [Clostridia bacterium]